MNITLKYVYEENKRDHAILLEKMGNYQLVKWISVTALTVSFMAMGVAIGLR